MILQPIPKVFIETTNTCWMTVLAGVREATSWGSAARPCWSAGACSDGKQSWTVVHPSQVRPFVPWTVVHPSQVSPCVVWTVVHPSQVRPFVLWKVVHPSQVRPFVLWTVVQCTPKPGQTRILDGLAYFDSYYFCFQAKHLQIFSNVVYSDKKIRILIQDSKTCKQNLHLSF